MATPDFILSLREKIGHDPLWLSGVTAVVLRPPDGTEVPVTGPPPAGTQVLIVKRADNGKWTPVTGIIDPLEEPAAAGVREVEEEADIVARALRLVSVEVVGPMTYENGDRSAYLDVCFAYAYVSGRPYPADGENTEARWCHPAELPEMSPRFRNAIARTLAGDPLAAFS